MKVFKPGTTVLLHDDLVVTVNGVWVQSGDRVQYQVSWIHNGARNESWVHDHEVCPNVDSQEKKVGFLP